MNQEHRKHQEEERTSQLSWHLQFTSILCRLLNIIKKGKKIITRGGQTKTSLKKGQKDKNKEK